MIWHGKKGGSSNSNSGLRMARRTDHNIKIPLLKTRLGPADKRIVYTQKRTQRVPPKRTLVVVTATSLTPVECEE